MSDIKQLLDDIEKATIEQQSDLLDRTLALLYPKPNKEDEPEWQGPGTLREPLYHHWYTRKLLFTQKLEVEAYESAAIMLLKDDWDYGIYRVNGIYDAEYGPSDSFMTHHGRGQTAALALCAAILEAEER